MSNVDDAPTSNKVVIRGFIIWLVLICAEIFHGITRAVLLVPFVGEFRSNQIGVFTGSAIIIVIAYFTIQWIGAKRTSELVMVGCIWLVLTVAFEVLFGRLVMGLTWERIGSDLCYLNKVSSMITGVMVLMLCGVSAFI